MALKIIQGGLLSTFQDQGRQGYQNMGIPQGGAMDMESHYIANALVSKPYKAPVLEMTAHGVTLEAEKPMVVAVTGGRGQIYKNDVACNMYESIPLVRGDRLRVENLQGGLRAYLAFSHDLVLQEAFGSQSTYSLSGFGGYKGRALKAGDCLEMVDRPLPLTYSYQARENKGPIRVMVAYEGEDFACEDFFGQVYTVTSDISRMGLKLQGQPLEARGGHDIISSPVVPGTLQVPGNGQPIVLLNDGQTTGGYKRLGCVAYSDLSRLGQCKPGDVLRFEAITIEEARALKKAYMDHLHTIKDHLRPIDLYEVKVNDCPYYVSVEAKER